MSCLKTQVGGRVPGPFCQGRSEKLPLLTGRWRNLGVNLGTALVEGLIPRPPGQYPSGFLAVSLLPPKRVFYLGVFLLRRLPFRCAGN